TATLGIALSEALAPLALDSATVSVTSASFDNVTDAFLSVSGRTGTISFPVGATLPDTLTLEFTVDGMDPAGNRTDATAAVAVTIIK
ncbi:MAG: hypothetical protein RIF33_15565, partial [Cyclobacteriaceae bacterium]